MCANEINGHLYGLSKEQWESCPERVKDFIRNHQDQFVALQKMYGNQEIIDMLCGRGGQAVKRKGLSLETRSGLDEFRPTFTGAEIASGEVPREEAVKEITNYFKHLYGENRDELISDYNEIQHHAKIMVTAQNLEKLKKDNPLLLNTKYFAEGHATPEEQQKLKEETDRLVEYYKSHRAEAETEYNNAFTKNLNKKNRLGTGEQIDWENNEQSSARIRELAEHKALKSFDIGPDRMKMIARDIVDNEYYYKAVNVNVKYDNKIQEIKNKAETPAMRKARHDFALEDLKRQDEIAKLMSEAETEQSKAIRAEYKTKSEEYKEKIYQAQKEGDDNKVAMLQKEFQDISAKAKEDIKAALDPEKKKAADALATERMDKLKAFNDEYDKQFGEKALKDIAELESKRMKELAKVKEASDKNIDKIDLDKFAEMMAEAQVDQMEAEARVDNTVVHWNNNEKKTIDKKDGKNHTFPFSGKNEKEMRDYIKNNGDKFGKPLEDQTSNDFDYEYNGQKYKFDSDMYKERMIQLAGEHGLDNEYKTDARHKADFYAQLPDRKALIDDVESDNLDQINLKQRRMAAALFKGAGLDVGGDQTIGKRWGGLATAAGIGAVTSGGAALLMEYYSTTKLATGVFNDIVTLTGSIPYSKMVDYSGVKDVTLTGKTSGYTDAHLETDISDVAYGDVSIPYKDTYTYSGSGNLTGTFTGGGVASTTVTVPQTSQVWENGILQSEMTTNKTQNVSVPYEYAHDYNLPYTYSGNGVVEGVATGQAGIPYTQHVSIDGKAYFETDVELTDKVEYEGKVLAEGNAEGQISDRVTRDVTDARTKIDLGRVGKAAGAGFVSGALAYALTGWNKTYDDTDSPYARTRSLVASKNVQGRNLSQIQLNTAPEENEEADDETVTTPSQVKESYESCVISQKEDDIPPVKINIGVRKTGRQIKDKNGQLQDEYEAHLWPSLYNAYGIKKEDQAAFRKQYSKEVLGGKTYFGGGEQSIPPTFTFKGQPLRFNKTAFDNTPKDKYYRAAGPTSARVNAGGIQGATTWSGTATCQLGDGSTKQFVTTKAYSSETEAKNDLKAQIAQDKSLTEQQKQEALKSVDVGCKQKQ